MNPDDIPDAVTSLCKTGPWIIPKSPRQTAYLLAHFWPAIEAHICEQIAQEIEGASLARLEEIDEDDRRPSHWERHGEWCDAADVARSA